MSDDLPARLLALGTPGQSLTVSVRRQPVPAGEPWFDTAIRLEAHPFSGTLDTVFTLSGLRAWAESLAALDQLPNRAQLGGDRAASLTIEASRQIGGAPGAVVALIELTPSEDDPVPLLRTAITGLAPFWDDARAAIARLR